MGIGACGTAKAGSGFPTTLLALRDATTKAKNWGLEAHTIIDDDVLCMVWVDLNTVQLMTTAYSLSDVETSDFLSPKKRHGIPKNSIKQITPPYLPSIAAHTVTFGSDVSEGLPIPYPIREYNKYMGGSDGNAQQREVYTLDRRFSRYWWPLFIFLHDAACLNAYIIYRSTKMDSRCLTREEFIRQIAAKLMNNPLGNLRKHQSSADALNVRAIEPSSGHHWIHLPKKRECTACKASQRRPHRRNPLAEIDGNAKARRQRGSQTRWGCGAWACRKKAACKKEACWKYIHSKPNLEEN